MLCLAALAATGCRTGSSTAADTSRGTAPASGAEFSATLYRDGAEFRHRRHVKLGAGATEVVFPGVPATLEQSSAQLRSLSDSDTRAVRWRFQPEGEPKAKETEPGELLALQGETAIASADRPTSGQGELIWNVVATRAGSQLLEQSYELANVRWRAGYALVLGAGGGSARFQGWLTVANGSTAPVRADSVHVVDAPLRPEREKAPAEPRESGTAPAPAPAPERPRAIAIDVPIRVGAGEERQFGLWPGGAALVDARVTRIFDPVGDGLNVERRRPRSAQQFGTGATGDVLMVTEIDLDSAGLPKQLPPGPITLFQRDGAALTPVGTVETRGMSSTADGGKRLLRLPVGAAQSITGKRVQSDYHYAPERRRLLEGIRVRLTNDSEHEVEVVVREHLYRGLNWTLAYFNDAGPIEKTGAQALEIRVRVPARGEALVAYRVAYTW